MCADSGLAPTPDSDQLLSGWGRTAPTRATVVRPQTRAELAKPLCSPPERGVIARGLGRSYGDAAQNAGGVVLETTGVARLHEIDLLTGLARVDAGMSLDSLMRRTLPLGWFVPVTPGTRHVTVGGAIAADIHGKNHHVDGSFCSHVVRLSLATPGGVVETGPDREAALFWATAGGMGLTGVIVEATIRLMSVETTYMSVDTERARDLDDTLHRLAEGDDRYQYSVAWFDAVARGRSMGRSVLTRARHARLAELAADHRSGALRFDPKPGAALPRWVPGGLLNRLTVRAFNEVWFRKAPRLEIERLHPMASFFHPLDGLEGWNRLYGPRGFVQYQFVVPFGREDALNEAVERLSQARCSSFLAVLKRFGPSNPGPLSFPIPGWTLALDIPVGSEALGPLLDGLDGLVAEAGGRVYLAKDARLRPELVATMYPRLQEWRHVQRGADPAAVLRSDLSRRLSLLCSENNT